MPGEPGDERNKTVLIPSPPRQKRFGHHAVQPALPMSRVPREPCAEACEPNGRLLRSDREVMNEEEV